ncbi:MAG: ComEA family DNA-binding protein [Microbacteriaceae bacterium]|mgnify:CR=1 FL=1|nr:ComEA family DNA-binding protein [Microbacteriaceae bacterium]
MPNMDVLDRFSKGRFKVGLGAASILILGALIVAVLIGMLSQPKGTVSRIAVQSAVSTNKSTGEIYVHVAGEVIKPGIYRLRDGSRIIDLISIAGGFTEFADRAALNLAQRLQDEDQLIVPKLGASQEAGNSGSAQQKVNLNQADAKSLESLPHVGPSLAARIVAWREEHGRFRKVEDLLGVPGIGPKTFADLKSLVTI